MSESEFDLYLSLLGKFLKLKPGQRDEIADELRDHLEARLEELSKSGLSREAAVHAALGEFGDAAELAQHFAQIARRRRRRFLMRCTFGTVACLTAAILFTTAFWPGDHAGPMPRPAIAQETIDAKTTVKFPAPGVLMDPIDAESRKLVESKLAGHQAEFKFADKRLKEALEAIGDAVQVDIVLDEESLKNCGVDPDLTVTFGLKYAKMSAATQLRMMLAKYKLGYFIKDGLVVVDTLGNAENHTDVRIYNCRDLLHKFRRKAERVLAVRGSDADAEVEAVKKSIWFSTPENADPDQIAAQELIEVLCAYSGGNWEITSGDGGYITEYNGLLIAQNTQDALRSLERTLEVLREIDEQTLPEAISISDPPADKKQ